MSIREKMIIAMDINGYEQDGKGLDFINLNSAGETLHFRNNEELYQFIVKNFVKH